MNKKLRNLANKFGVESNIYKRTRKLLKETKDEKDTNNTYNNSNDNTTVINNKLPKS